MEIRCYSKILNTSYKDQVTNEDLLTIVKRRKLKRSGHVSRSSGLAKTIIISKHSEKGKKTGRTEKEVGRQHQGLDRPEVRQVPEDNVENKRKMEETGCEVICSAPTTPAVKR